MKVPTCRIYALGELTNWAKQFLGHLQNEQVVDITFEPSVTRFCDASSPHTAVVFVENAPDMKQAIGKLRTCGKNLFIMWFGKNFSKEDLAFALENRIYWVFENPRPDEKKILDGIKRVAHGADVVQHFEQHFHSMKAILIQASTDDGTLPLIQEIKTALSKLERSGIYNEFLGDHFDQNLSNETKLPFHRSQDLADALITVHDLERTGALWVKGSLPKQEGKVEFLQGKIVAVVSGEVRGTKALFRMFLWDEPRYLFTRIDPESYVLEDHLNISIKHTCDEAVDLKNRFQKIRRELPPADLRLELEPSALHAGTQLSKSEFSTLSSVIEFNTVEDVVDYNTQSDVLIYEALIQLRKHNMIRVAAT